MFAIADIITLFLVKNIETELQLYTMYDKLIFGDKMSIQFMQKTFNITRRI